MLMLYSLCFSSYRTDFFLWKQKWWLAIELLGLYLFGSLALFFTGGK
jgi:hypothetical protein